MPADFCLQEPRSLCSNLTFELLRMGFLVLYLNCVAEDFHIIYLYLVVECGVCSNQVLLPNFGKM